METPDYFNMMTTSNHYSLDGPTEQYHKHLVHSQTTKESTQLENINRFFDKCKEQKVHELDLEQRELKKTLRKLEREKIEIKKKGSAVDKQNNDEEKKRKGVVVKLQPGKIDFERMSPPSSHDVAVRMLFDKKSQAKKKKPRKKSDHLIASGPESLEKSFSHKETSVTLPALSDEEKTQRRFSVSGSENHAAEHDARYKHHGSKGSKPKKRGKKKSPVIHVPSPTRPEIVVQTPDEDKKELASSSSTSQADHLPCSSFNDMSKKTGPPKSPYRAWSGVTDSIAEEIDQLVAGQGSKLPQLPNKSNLVETTTLPTAQQQQQEAYARKRRASMDYRDLDFMKGSSSFTPATSFMHRRASVGGPHDVSKPEDGLGKKSSKTKSTKKLDIYMLDHYYALLSDTQKILKEEDPSFALPRDASKHLPLCTLKRSQRRKALALEILLKQLPGYRHTEIEPKDMLNCRYLRLSRNNIESLEDMCRQEGHDAGLHPHMTQQEVEDYFEELDRQVDSDTDSEVELMCGATYTDRHPYH